MIKFAISFLLICCGIERIANALDLLALSKVRYPHDSSSDTPISNGGCGFQAHNYDYHNGR